MYEINNRVNTGFRNDPRYARALESLTKMLEKEADVDVYAIHEAGHLAYFLRMGIPESEIIFRGPTILHKLEIGEFVYFPCELRVHKKYLNDVDLESLAKAAAAGGVYERELKGTRYLGDTVDREVFHSRYSVRSIAPAKDESEMWEWAQNEVRLDLTHESNRTEAYKNAKRIREKCFRVCG